MLKKTIFVSFRQSIPYGKNITHFEAKELSPFWLDVLAAAGHLRVEKLNESLTTTSRVMVNHKIDIRVEDLRRGMQLIDSLKRHYNIDAKIETDMEHVDVHQ